MRKQLEFNVRVTRVTHFFINFRLTGMNTNERGWTERVAITGAGRGLSYLNPRPGVTGAGGPGSRGSNDSAESQSRVGGAELITAAREERGITPALSKGVGQGALLSRVGQARRTGRRVHTAAR